MRLRRVLALILMCITVFCSALWCGCGESNQKGPQKSISSSSKDMEGVEHGFDSANDVHIDASYDLLRKGSFSSATETIQTVLNTDPNNALALNNLGVLLAIKAEYASALSVFLRAQTFAGNRKIGGTTCQTSVGDTNRITVVSALHSPAYDGKVSSFFRKSGLSQVVVLPGDMCCVPLEYAYYDDPVLWSSGSIKAVRTKPSTAVITKPDGTKQTVPAIIYKKVSHPEEHRKVDGTENLYFLDIEVERNIACMQYLLDHDSLKKKKAGALPVSPLSDTGDSGTSNSDQ